MINWPSGPASIEDHGRPAVDKLLVRRNSGLTLQGLDLGLALLVPLGLALLNWPSGPASIEDRGRPAVDKLLARRNSGLGPRGLDLGSALLVGAGLDKLAKALDKAAIGGWP